MISSTAGPAAAEAAEQVDLRIGDLRVGQRQCRFGIGEGAFGIQLRKAIDLSLALLGTGDARGDRRLIARGL